MKRKAWGSFFSPQIAKMCSLGPKKAPPGLTFHKGFAKLATLTWKCSPGDQFWLTIVDPNQFSKTTQNLSKIQSKWSIYSCSKSIFQKNIFSQKVFRFGSYIVMPNQWNLFCKNHNIFQFRRQIEAPYWFSILNSFWNLIFQFGTAIFLPNWSFSERFFPSEKSIWSFYLPSKMIFHFAILQKTENQYGSAICFPNWSFFARGATWLRTLRKHYET